MKAITETPAAMPPREITRTRAALVFVSFTAYFYLLLFTLRPFLMAHFTLNPALYWFITGYFLAEQNSLIILVPTEFASIMKKLQDGK